MASEKSLNQIVKGAPPPDTKVTPPAPLPSLAQSSNEVLAVTKSKARSNKHNAPSSIADSAVAALPSSPSQIYLNLLILETSLRAQYLHLLSRRRLNTFFLLLLLLWNLFFTWALFFRPREDGTGHGGSVYWVIETGEKVFFMGGIVTVLLVKATGQWERGIRWPRRWIGTTNRGLRGFNLRVVVTRGRWWSDLLSPFAFLLPFGLWREAGGSDWNWIEESNGTLVEEDLAKGGDHIMLLLLPKNFSSEFRENWEGFRTEYWERENERRAGLRKKVQQQRRQKAKETGGWMWWTGAWRLLTESHAAKRRHQDLEKHPHHAHAHLSAKDALIKQSRRRSTLRDGSHSRQSSRSSTPNPSGIAELDGSGIDLNNSNIKPMTERVRRGSSVSSTSSLRRSTKGSVRRADGMLSPLTAADIDDDTAVVREKERRAKKRERERELVREKEKERALAGRGGSFSSIGDAEGESDGRRPSTPMLDKENAVSKDTEMHPGPAAA